MFFVVQLYLVWYNKGEGDIHMIHIRVAQMSDTHKVMTMLNEAEQIEKDFLRFSNHDMITYDRIVNNIANKTVSVLVVDDEVVGFIEYRRHPYAGIWIFSLFVMKEYRVHSTRFAAITINAMKRIERCDINFAVHNDNRAMHTLLKYVRAIHIRDYGDDRQEWRIKYEKKK